MTWTEVSAATVVVSKKVRTGQSSGVRTKRWRPVTSSLIPHKLMRTTIKLRSQATLVPEKTMPIRRSKTIGIKKRTINTPTSRNKSNGLASIFFSDCLIFDCLLFFMFEILYLFNYLCESGNHVIQVVFGQVLMTADVKGVFAKIFCVWQLAGIFVH